MTLHQWISLAAGLSLIAGASSLSAIGAASAQDGDRPELAPMARVPAARAEAMERDQDEGDRIFFGTEAESGEYPFQVALLTSNALDESVESQANAQFCGGSLISETWILTAAHCLVYDGAPINPADVTILAGATDLREGTRHAVAEVNVHEGYNEQRLDNDIGLLRLADPVTDGRAIAMTDSFEEAGAATVIGWGMMENGSFPHHLMEVGIDVYPNASCNDGMKEIYASDLAGILKGFSTRMHYSEEAVDEALQLITSSMDDPLTDNMICAGVPTGNRDACNGDSGGPLFATEGGEPVQIGIVSWGEGPFDAGAACGHADAYGVYTRLANYRGWVDGHMGN